MTELKDKKCKPCEGETKPLTPEEIFPYQGKIDKAWKVLDAHHLERTFTFDNFVNALGFTNSLGAIAEEEGHHPNIFLTWGKVVVELWTHEVDGLTENDFISAAKYDEAYGKADGVKVE